MKYVSKQDKNMCQVALAALAVTPVVVGLACITAWMCDNLVYYYGYDYKIYGPAVVYGSLALLFLLTSVLLPSRKRRRRNAAAD